MRRSMFGDYYATSTEDDIAEAFLAKELEPSECFADITLADDGSYCVDIRECQSGEDVVSTDEGLFSTPEAARKWAEGWVPEVINNF